ncbi:MAG: RNA polymerase sigma factor [Polyangiaceae bacterium]
MVDQHFDFIWRSLRGLGVSPAFADDAAQQVFLIASQKLDRVAVGSERGFLFSTARGIAANFRRGQRRSPEVADDLALAGHHDAAPNPEQAASSNQAKEWLDQFLESLPPDLRTVFVLYELEGLTTTEIADLSEMPTGTVASRLRRAREAFQDAIKRFRAKERMPR